MEIQQQLPHPTQHMNIGDVIQIDVPEFDPDIDGRPPMKEYEEIQGSDSSIQHLLGESEKREAPALPQQVAEEVDWLDAVPVKILPQSAQDTNHKIRASPTQHEMNYSEIPQLESDIDEEEEGQFEDIQTNQIIITPIKKARIFTRNIQRDYWTLMMKSITGI